MSTTTIGPPDCVCGHKWTAHFDWDLQREHECTECEDLAYFEDIQPLDVCEGYLPQVFHAVGVLQSLPLGTDSGQEA